MNRKFMRLTLAALVALVAIGAAWPFLAKAVKVSNGSGASGSTWVAGPCSMQNQGVTLAVDFGSAAERRPVLRCLVAGDKTDTNLTGWSLFESVGLNVEGTEQYPEGFVCRIESVPSKAAQPCTSTPALRDGTWVYFQSAQGSPWRFAMRGAASVQPTCGDFEGWRFVLPTDGAHPKPPRVSPNSFKCQK